MKKISLIAISFLLVAFAEKTQTASFLPKQQKELCNYFPANNLRFPIRENAGQITRPQFRKILDAVESVYKPIFQSYGLGRFYVVDRWFDDTVNACASIGNPCSQIQRKPGQIIKPVSGFNPKINDPSARFVEIYGGLARHPYITSEALMVVICHEIGHHIGGYPRYGKNESPMATEGQSDYFATAKCARMIYSALSSKTNENWAWTNKNNIPAEVVGPCQRQFAGQPLQMIFCARSSLAGLSLARVLGSLKNQDPSTINFKVHDTNVVKETYEGHPAALCRLDTYVAGALCTQDQNVSFSMNNPNTGACTNPRAYGTRPACWYKN